MFHDALQARIIRALAAGARQLSPTQFEWDVSGSCRAPVTREFHARPSPEDSTYLPRPQGTGTGKLIIVRPGKKHPLSLVVHARCRKCPPCLALRRGQWSLRAAYEMRNAARTWFGTMTLSPENHVLMANRARFRLGNGGTDFDNLSDGEQFAERHSEVSREITKYFKRLRFNSGSDLRYLLVAEKHKSGLPHYHALIHEVSEDSPVKYRELTQEWPFGFTSFKLVADVKTASYVTKYLGKSNEARIRASVRYGRGINKGETNVNGVPLIRKNTF